MNGVLRAVGRWIAALALVLVALPALSGCSVAEQPLQLNVTGVEWNGWDTSAVPTPTSTQINVEVGEQVTSVWQVSFEVVAVRGDEVDLRTSQPLVVDGVSFDDAGTLFTLRQGTTTKLTTTTMDAGASFELRLSR